MAGDAGGSAEFYELAEDFIRLQFRLANAGLRLLPRRTRQHAVEALNEAFSAAQATRQHFAQVFEEGMAQLSRDAAAQGGAARKVRVVREGGATRRRTEPSPPSP